MNIFNLLFTQLVAQKSNEAPFAKDLPKESFAKILEEIFSSQQHTRAIPRTIPSQAISQFSYFYSKNTSAQSDEHKKSFSSDVFAAPQKNIAQTTAAPLHNRSKSYLFDAGIFDQKSEKDQKIEYTKEKVEFQRKKFKGEKSQKKRDFKEQTVHHVNFTRPPKLKKHSIHQSMNTTQHHSMQHTNILKEEIFAHVMDSDSSSNYVQKNRKSSFSFLPKLHKARKKSGKDSFGEQASLYTPFIHQTITPQIRNVQGSREDVLVASKQLFFEQKSADTFDAGHVPQNRANVQMQEAKDFVGKMHNTKESNQLQNIAESYNLPNVEHIAHGANFKMSRDFSSKKDNTHEISNVKEDLQRSAKTIQESVQIISAFPMHHERLKPKVNVLHKEQAPLQTAAVGNSAMVAINQKEQEMTQPHEAATISQSSEGQNLQNVHQIIDGGHEIQEGASEGSQKAEETTSYKDNLQEQDIQFRRPLHIRLSETTVRVFFSAQKLHLQFVSTQPFMMDSTLASAVEAIMQEHGFEHYSIILRDREKKVALHSQKHGAHKERSRIDVKV